MNCSSGSNQTALFSAVLWQYISNQDPDAKKLQDIVKSLKAENHSYTWKWLRCPPGINKGSINKVILGAHIVAQCVKSQLATPASYVGTPVWFPAAPLPLPIQLPANMLGKHQKWQEYLEPSHPCGRSRCSSTLLASQATVDIWGVNQEMEVACLSLFPLLYHSFINIKYF